MRVLVADDDPVYRRLLESTLSSWGFEILLVSDGSAAWKRLSGEDGPQLAILNWMMPGMDGAEVCCRLKEHRGLRPVYIIMLTARGSATDIAAGLRAGADDYVVKPFDHQELQARLQAGERVLALQTELARRVTELEGALSQVRRLSGLLPMCSYCKKVRDDQNYWRDVADYVSSHSEASFSHGLCPDCRRRYFEGGPERGRVVG